jgi:hypothetical protein
MDLLGESSEYENNVKGHIIASMKNDSLNSDEFSQPSPRVTIEVTLMGGDNQGRCLVLINSYEGHKVHTLIEPDQVIEADRQSGSARITVPCLAEHGDYSVLLFPRQIWETQTRFLKVRQTTVQR